MRSIILVAFILLAKAGFSQTTCPAAACHRLTDLALSLKAGLSANAISGNCRTLLTDACIQDDSACVKLLLQNQADPNLADAAGNTPLMRAAIRGNTVIMQLLLNAGADPNKRNFLNTTALIQAATFDHPQAVQLLLDNGADKKTKDKLGYSALDYARSFEHSSIALLLTQKKQDLIAQL